MGYTETNPCWHGKAHKCFKRPDTFEFVKYNFGIIIIIKHLLSTTCTGVGVGCGGYIKLVTNVCGGPWEGTNAGAGI